MAMASKIDAQSRSVNSAQAEGESGEEQVPPPVGTLFVLIAYLAILAGMWGFMYMGLITR